MSQKIKKPRFFRQSWNKMIKLGKQTKKKRKWRNPRGGDSKVRLKEKGYSRQPSVGYSRAKKERGRIKGLETIRIENIKQLESIKEKQGIIIGKIGKKKREDILKKAEEKKLIVLNKYKTKGEKKDAIS